MPPAFCAEGARTLNLIAQRRKVLSLLGSASAACFQNQSLPGLSQLSDEMRDGIALARHVNLLSALTSKTRHATKSGEVPHFATLLNSGDPATLFLGTPHAPVKSVDVLGTQQMVPLEQVRTNPEHLKIPEGWLRSYRPKELSTNLAHCDRSRLILRRRAFFAWE